MDIQGQEQELTHLELKPMGNVRHNLAIEEDEAEVFGSVPVESSSEEDSRESSLSCSSTFSSFDVEEDASSSSSISSPCSSSMELSSDGPLYSLSMIMSQLPIKRGLSKFYDGKSQSFTSLARVESTEDLGKKGWHKKYGSRMKSCKSFGGLLEQSNNRAYSPRATISKKATKAASANMSSLGRRAALLEACGFSVPATEQESILQSKNPGLQPLPTPQCKRI